MEYNKIIMYTNNSEGDGILKKDVSSSSGGGSSEIPVQQPYQANRLNVSGQTELSSNMPVIEIATYSEIDVYECYIRGFESRIVMRRKNNDWINITQVLKLASFSKTKRTKILEKESSHMQHEKVQGGYGRFQGTWIPLDSAKELIQKYNIEDPVISTLVNFVLDPHNPPPRRSKNSILKKTSPGVKIHSPSSYNKTPKKNNASQHSTTSSTISNGIKKHRRKFGSGSGQLLQINPSPLNNIIFQTPQQPNVTSISNSNMSVNTVTDTTVESLSTVNNQQLNSDYITNENHSTRNPTFVTNGYSATQKPLQFFPVPSISGYANVNNTDNDRNESRSNSGNMKRNSSATKSQGKYDMTSTRRPKESSFLTFIPDSRNKTFTSSEHITVDQMHFNNTHVNSVGNKDSKKITKRRKKQNSNSNVESDPISAQDKVQQNFQVIKQKMVVSETPNIDKRNTSSYSAVSSSSTQASFITGSNLYSQLNKTAGDIPSVSENEYKDLILQTLSSEDITSSNSLPLVLYNPPADLDLNFEVDDQGHSALHWATAMSNVPLIKLLISLNIDIFKCNKRGFNCITKLIFYNNSYKAGTFVEIISILKMCLITSDDNNRLPLHYLVELSVNKSKDPAVINYYIETIVKTLASENYSLLKMCLNHQDNMGNTLLHLSALNLNVDLYNKLIELGASKDLPNFNSETPFSILSKYNLIPNAGEENLGYMQPIELQESFQSPDPAKSFNGNKKPLHMDIAITNSPYKSRLHNSNEHNILGHDMTNNISFTMEDISELDNLVTSSVVKGSDSVNQNMLKNSPMLYKSKSSSELNRNILQQPITFTEQKNQKPLKLEFNNDVGHGEEFAVTHDHLNHPGDEVSEIVETQSMKSTSKLGMLTLKLHESLKNDVKRIQQEISQNKRKIDVINYQLESTANQKRILSSQLDNDYNIKTFEQLYQKKINLQKQFDEIKTKFFEKFEIQQRQTFSDKLKEVDSSSAPKQYDGKPIESLNETDIEKLVQELKKSRERKTTLIKNIADAIATSTSSVKIEKYRKLIGLTIENVDAKLDEIENELSMSI